MKKTLTSTFHSPNNNGSFLQAYALQKILKERFGVENKIIDLQIPAQQQQYAIMRPWNSFGNAAKNLISLLHYTKLKKRINNFKEFRKNFLDTTPLCTTVEQAIELAKQADVNIVGSDQIWNVNARDFSSFYFMNGVNTKKVSYAVSCGSHISSKDLEPYHNDISLFDCISVRERATQNILNSFNISSQVCVDPTVLLNAEDYFPLLEKSGIKTKKPYIFLYTINYNKTILKMAKRISKLLKMPVITPFCGYSAVNCSKFGIKVAWDVCPADFLSLVYNAHLVLTNSFHGTVFSTIFKKNFYHVCEGVKEHPVHDDRINGFLDILCLQRSITEDVSADYIQKNLSVDYDNIDAKIDNLRQSSFAYLSNALN